MFTLRHAFIFCALAALSATAQQAPSSRLVRLVVTDSANRMVTGLNSNNFEVLENGLPRPFALFEGASPASIAVVGPLLPSVAGAMRPDDELIDAAGVADAVQRLSSSKNARRVLIASTGTDTQNVPEGIQVLIADEATLPLTLREVHQSYVIELAPAATGSSIDVRLKPPKGLPPLKLDRR